MQLSKQSKSFGHFYPIMHAFLLSDFMDNGHKKMGKLFVHFVQCVSFFLVRSTCKSHQPQMDGDGYKYICLIINAPNAEVDEVGNGERFIFEYSRRERLV